jgi:hypothetical protein
MHSNASPFDTHLKARTITDAAIAISKSRITMFALFVATVVAIAATLEWEWALQLSGFAFGLGKATFGFALVRLVDEYIFHGFNVRDEIKAGNVAAAIYLVGLFAFVGLVLWST